MNFPATLRQLWEMTGIDPESVRDRENEALSGVGLFLPYPLENGGAGSTPLNSVMFARTGGDGTHYSLILDNGEVSDASPVVMTVPFSNTQNLVVGSDLREFLALGCRFGYFTLEDLVYDWEKAIAELAGGEYQHFYDDADRCLLAKLASTFQLSPWPDPERRLIELQSRYAPLLELPKMAIPLVQWSESQWPGATNARFGLPPKERLDDPNPPEK